MTTTMTTSARRAQLMQCAEAYFEGIRRKDMSDVPWHRDLALRSPLAPGFPEPLIGRDAVVQWFAGLYPALGGVEVIAHHIDEESRAVATRADVYLASGVPLRVIDRFVVDAAGLIVEQENHYDPRPALNPPPGAISPQERDLLLDLLGSSERALLASIVGLTPAQWDFRPGAGSWSIAQCAEHLALSEDGLREMVRGQILASAPSVEKESSTRARDGVIVSAMRDRSHRSRTFDFLEPRSVAATPAEFIASFLGKRARTIEYVRQTQDALHHHFAPLGPLGELDAYQWLLLLASHTERHVQQIEEIKRSGRYPA